MTEIETPAEFGKRKAEYIMNANKPLSIYDPELQPKTKAVAKAEEPKENPIDKMIDDFEKQGQTPAVPLHEYVAKIQKEMEKP